MVISDKKRIDPEPKLVKRDAGKIEMNNFYMYLPGGYYREFYDEDEEKAGIMDEIDRLLALEFPALDVVTVIKITAEIRRFVSKTLKPGAVVFIPEEKIDMKKLEEAKEGLRPLFNRLIEIGYDPVVLSR